MRYTYAELKTLEQTIPGVKTKIKNNRFVFDDTTRDLEFVYLRNSNNDEHENNKELTELVFATIQPKLRYLNANNCGLKKITIENCPNLQTLFLFGNQIEEITFKGSFPNLELIDLSRNALTRIDLPFEDFPSLKYLYLHQNNLVDLAGLSRFFLKDDFDFNIEKNTNLLKPPVEIASQNKTAVINWFKATKKTLKEIKILVIGDAEAGKTSICKRLEFDTFDKHEKQTDGIKIQKLEFEKLTTFKEQKQIHGLTGYFWDFGGQEIMKSTHQFFLTHRSIYILVLEARNDKSSEKQIAKWLESIQSQGGKSPIIIVINKIEVNRAFDIDTYNLTKVFPQISGFIKISCETNENLDELKVQLEKCIPDAELFNTEIDERWIEIKNELQQKTREAYKLTESDYINICKKYNLTDSKEQHECVKFLNDLGIVLHFDELDLAEYYILDPLWVTTGVYRIITSETAAKQSGMILYENLTEIINVIGKGNSENHAYSSISYTPNESRYLIDIMAMFKLCFFAENKKIIFIPDLFDKETPATEVEKILSNEDKLEFIYDYPFLHHSVISRLIVEVNGEIQKFWRTGIIVESKTISATALIRTFADRVLITLVGNKKDKRQYLSHIRFFVEKINEEFNLKPNLLMPLPGLQNKTAKYDHLIKLERRGDLHYEDLDTDKVFEISQLLDGIDSADEIQQQGQTIINNYNTINITGMNPDVIRRAINNADGFMVDKNSPNKIFISYSSKDRELREIFEEHLKVHLASATFNYEIVWSDVEIPAGVNWHNEIQSALQTSNIGILLVSPRFLGSKYCTGDEFRQMLDRQESERYHIIPVLLRECNFQNNGALKATQFVKTYQSEYGVNDPLKKNKLMPFDELVEIDKPNERLLNKYFLKITNAIDTAISTKVSL